MGEDHKSKRKYGEGEENKGTLSRKPLSPSLEDLWKPDKNRENGETYAKKVEEASKNP